MKSVFSSIVDGLNKPLKSRYLDEHEVEARLLQLNNTIDELDQKKMSVNMDIQMKLIEYKRPGLSDLDRETIFQEWRVLMQQSKFYNIIDTNLKRAKANVDVAKMNVEFGKAIDNSIDLVRTFNSQTMDMDKLLKKFRQSMEYINTNIEGLDKFDKAMSKYNGFAQDTGEFSKDEFMKMVNGDQNESAKELASTQKAQKTDDLDEFAFLKDLF